MEFLEDYQRLEAGQRDRFQQVVTRLLSGEVITPGSPLKPDLDWKFADRYRDLIDSYLRIGGWRLDIDLGLRLARAVHEAGSQRVRFSKLESLLLCSLRLYYHEQMRSASEEESCEINIGALRERLVHAGKPAVQLSARILAQGLRRLGRHSLLHVPRGFEGRDDEVVLVMPLIEKVLPPDRIQEIEEKIKAYIASRAPVPLVDTPDQAEAAGEIESEEEPA
jgi:uncharacterized protein DUF4194